MRPQLQATRPRVNKMEYRLKVIGPDEVARELAVQAQSAAQATRLASARGLRVLSLVQAHEPTGQSTPGGVGSVGGLRSSRFDLLLFSQELVALLQAGLHVAAALQALARKAEQPPTRQVLDALVLRLNEGRALSDALSEHPQVFPQIYIAAVRANENSGGLADAIARFVRYQEQMEALRRKVISASIYPVLLITVALFVSLFLVGFVVPKFSAVYESAGREAPLLSRALMGVGAWIHTHMLTFSLGVSTALAALGFALSRASVRQALLERITRAPGLRHRAHHYRLGRLYRTLSVLLHSGLALPRAVILSSDTLGSAQRSALQRVVRALEEGLPLSQALHREALATPIADSLVRVGEASGNLSQMLERAAQFHDDEFERWLDVATRTLEPLLMVLIGLVIGAVVVLMYLPIFDLAGSLG